MSLGYADRLSHREDLGGRLGDPELFEAPHIVLDKSKELAELIRDAAKVVVFTGAGISTAAGIPDFRGPQGVWTLQRKGLPLPKLHTSFVYAKPSLTHQALLGLMQSGKLQYICSQNVDSLHLRSGVPRSQLAELHGNCFAERCKKCKAEYVRDFEMDTVGFKQTGRRCSKPGCRGMLVDHILDWEDALPPAELKATEQHAAGAGLSLCLGTSLQIIPAANLPLRTVRTGGKLAIVNLQATPKDKKAHCVVHAHVDEVMSVIMEQLGIPIPVYTRTDRVQLSGNSWSFTLSISSLHGLSCPLPMVASASVSFLGDAAQAGLKSRQLSGQLPWRLTRRCPAGLQQVQLQVQFALVEAADEGRRSASVSARRRRWALGADGLWGV
ncbi:SIR2-family protein HDAC1 [Scenedesmus sp. NREL 46B-D3]|nr:SIR2-family protein HDAC1 [Scenedesmus sp. NREL 46B-D3]